MEIKKDPESFGNILKNKQGLKIPKPPAHPWQELALKIIKELSIPNVKRGSVFKVCKEKPKQFILNCLNDTKELCQTGAKWKYFFKVVGGKGEKKKEE